MWKLWRIGTVFGVPLKMHGTWVLLMAFYALSGFFSGGAANAALSLGLALITFAVVVLHELGHIAAYHRYGVETKDIILTPMGGIARGIGNIAASPKKEFIIAAAGPAVNVALAALSFLAIKAVPWLSFGDSGVIAWTLTNWFLNVNLILLVFNLIPALPMDGGRMLRAALTPRLGFLPATRLAARIARWSTLAMAIYALYIGSVTLFLVAGAVFVMSWMELAQAHLGQAAAARSAFQLFRGGFGRGPAGAAGGGTGGRAGTVVDQYGNPVGGFPGAGWSSAEHVRPTSDGRGWTVQSVRFLED